MVVSFGVQKGIATAPAPRLQVRQTFRNDGLLMAHYSDFTIAVWSRKPLRTTFNVQCAELKAAVGRNPGRTHFMCVVEAGADPPDPDIRNASSSMITEHGAKLASCACVIEGSGFRAALTRTVLSGIVLLMRSPAPQAFFEGVPAAALWQQERGARGSIAQLIAELRALREAAAR